MRTFLTKNLYVGNFFEKKIKLKSRQKIISNFKSTKESCSTWFQLTQAIPRLWKSSVLSDKGNSQKSHKVIKEN